MRVEKHELSDRERVQRVNKVSSAAMMTAMEGCQQSIRRRLLTSH